MKSIVRLLGVGAMMMGLAPMSAMAADTIELRVLSTRPDTVSGGDALVQIVSSGRLSSAKVTLDGHDISRAFHPAKNKTLIGVVTGLKPGANILEARAGGGNATLELTDYPITGPVFSGPHQLPFMCQTDMFTLPVTGGTLGAPLDINCSAKTRIDYVYKGMDGKFVPLPDPMKRPADVAQATTKDGRTVDYIVRVETGTINRSIYQVAVLHNPKTDKPLDPWAAPAGWNGRLVYNFGGSCGSGYHQGASMGAPVLTDAWLGLGYAVATATFNTWGNNCNDVLSPETVMMVREHIIEEFGPLVHTIGTGCSGGAMQIHLTAQNYPGLLDGIIPTCTHPDMVSYYPTNIGDVGLLKRALDAAPKPLDEAQKTAIAGYVSWNPIALSWLAFSPDWIVPDAPRKPAGAGCDASIPASMVYNASQNPRGTRCTIFDNMVNIFGRDTRNGFARRPLDNIGVQYGLVAFTQGKIDAEQFVSLNERIGGYDLDGGFMRDRMAGDTDAVRIAYETGQVLTGGGGMSATPILDVHTYAELVDHHSRVDGFMTRSRLISAYGDADNQVMITLPGRNINTLPNDMLLQMDKWLDNLAADPAPASHAKTVRNKPADLVDACYTTDGKKIVEVATLDGPGECNKLYPNYGNPRLAAGAPVASDILKCALKPVDARDYVRPIRASQITRLKAVFPQGVCDYSKPGINQVVTTKTWLRY